MLKKVKKTILIVDDDRHSREGLQELLRREGHRVEVAGDSCRAIMKVKHTCFDIIIVDLNLPAVAGLVLTGWDLIKICRAFHPETSAIIMSAEDLREVRAHASHFPEQDAIAAFLEKPIHPVQLKAIVEKVGAAV